MESFVQHLNPTSESTCLHSTSIRSSCGATAGRKILNEHIALAVLGTYGVIAATQMGGSKDAKAASGASPDAKANDPPINASSS